MPIVDFGSLPQRVGKGLQKVFGSANEREVTKLWPIVRQINELEEWACAMDRDAILARVGFWKEKVRRGDASLDEALPEMFAMTRVASQRTNGERHFDVQLIGGMALHQGKIAEMVTGEGKTLVATLAAALNALEGKGVYIVTVNDYLARRDRDWMAPIYEYLGFSVGAIQSPMDSQERHAHYACDITYGTNNEFGFDYLRDNMKVQVETQVQKSLNYAIIDEVDSILIDEARTPLIISGAPEEHVDKYMMCDRIARQLKEGDDFEVKLKEHQCLLLEPGIEKAERMVGVESFYSDPKHMDWPHHIEQSLRAHHIYKRDKEYVVKGEEIIIVDEFTGRLMPGRRWSDGLHQAVEAKEGITPRQENPTLATITLQNYFRLFKKIAGMTGTAMTEASEFQKIYKLDVVCIPTNRPLIRRDQNDQIYLGDEDKYEMIVQEVQEKLGEGRPVLVGTTSIEKSERLSRMLTKVGIAHEVLNAKHHEREAQIVANAGHANTVTVATNMAGRGTDIKLGEGVLRKACVHPETHATWCCIGCERPEKKNNCAGCFKKQADAGAWHLGIYNRCVDGERARKHFQKNNITDHPWQEHSNWEDPPCGLHIIGTERHEARRIDNQLRGRCGRQGDPGSTRFFLSFDDDLMRIFARDWVKTVMEKLGLKPGEAIESPMVTRGIAKAQKKVEQRNFDIRKSLLEYDEVMDKQRKFIYSQRQEVLELVGLEDKLLGMYDEELATELEIAAGDEDQPVDFKHLRDWLSHKLGPQTVLPELESIHRDQLSEKLTKLMESRFEARKAEFEPDDFQQLLRFLLLDSIDTKWKDHLRAMEALKAGIGLRGYAQVDPKNEYKKEGFEKFAMLKKAVSQQVTDLFFRIDVRPQELQVDDPFARGRGPMAGGIPMSNDPAEMQAMLEAMAAAGQLPPEVMEALARGGRLVVEPTGRSGSRAAPPAPPASRPAAPAKQDASPATTTVPKAGRNDPCPCGSGKKYKKCHGQ